MDVTELLICVISSVLATLLLICLIGLYESKYKSKTKTKTMVCDVVWSNEAEKKLQKIISDCWDKVTEAKYNSEEGRRLMRAIGSRSWARKKIEEREEQIRRIWKKTLDVIKKSV